MSIAQSIIEIVEAEAEKAGSTRVSELELEIGRLSGIEYEAIEFALKVMAPGSVIDGSKLIINKPVGEAVCLDCGKSFITDSPVNICPDCSSYSCHIKSGKELRVKSILID